MQSFALSDLRSEQRSNPLGIDTARPRLSWRLLSERRAMRQAAYRITAASRPTDLAAGDPLLWDSGRVASDQSWLVEYGGPALRSAQRVYWQVQVWDDTGATATSEPAWWELGLLAPADWQAEWVGAPFVGGPRTTSPAPFLRTSFTIEQPVARARLFISALGLVEPWLNGARIGEDLFAPGWTDYAKRVQYHTYDLTKRLRLGENVLGAILGDGWYCGYLAWRGRQQYGDRPKLLAQLLIELADGSTQLIVSGPGWQAAAGPILESDFLMGESYDARRELGNWAEPGYNASSWFDALLLPQNGLALSALIGPPVRRHEELRPIGLRAIADEHAPSWVFDMGQNMVGWVRLRVSGPAGATVTLRYAEALNADGSLHSANLRSARSNDHYTLRGGEELWEPHFTCHGFRFVELLGFPGVPDEETITGVVIHSAIEPIGTFSCSEPLVNQLQHNIVWGQKGNFVDVPTDCPQRDERLGWTGDAQVFVSTAAFNYDVHSFFARWLRDLEDAQGADGRVPAVVPTIAGLHDDGGPAWADAAVICPWEIYLSTGDQRLLEDRYQSMVRYIDYLSATSSEGLRCYAGYEGYAGYGDWLALDGGAGVRGRTSHELIGTAFYAYSTRLLGQIAAVLGRTADATRYEALFTQVRQAFQARFVTAGGLVAGETQTGYVLALHFDLLPAELRAAAAAELARLIEKNGKRLATGFVGTPYLAFVLSAAGRLDLAYELLMQRRWPSWLYSVTQGATTIWERWDGWTEERGFQTAGMNSFNHYAYGAIGAWLYSVVAGIAPDPQRPGYKHVLLRPQPGGGLTHARASLTTPYGQLVSDWRSEGGQFHWSIVVPPNSTATAYLPNGERHDLVAGSYELVVG